MDFYLERLVEWRHPSLVASVRLDAEDSRDFLRVACPACELHYLAAPADGAGRRGRARLAAAAALQLSDECPDHPAQFALDTPNRPRP